MLQSHKSYKCLPFLSIIYFLLGICPYVFGRNLVIIYGAALSLNTLIFFPLWFVLNDIIAEVYGYRIARNIFWSAAIGQFILGLIALCVIKIYIPQQIHEGYIAIFGGLPTQTIFALAIILSAWKINTFLLLRWKILMHGKYFWLRSIGSSVIGIILSQFFFFIYYIWNNNLAFNNLSYNIVNAFHRIVLVVLISIPAQLIVNLIKSIELIADKKTDIREPSLFTKKSSIQT